MAPQMTEQDSVADLAYFENLMERLRGRDSEAARLVFDRYAHRLVGLARKRLDPRVLRKEDPEDVIQSVFRSFFHRHEQGSIALENWESVWAMLAMITSRKCVARARFYLAECRDVDRERLAAATESMSGTGWNLDGGEPSPEEEAILDETIQELLGSLTEPKHRQIVLLTMQGLPAMTVSEQVPCTERMVHRVLERVRTWLVEHGRKQDS